MKKERYQTKIDRTIYISIVKNYTTTPGGRYAKEGPFSGEDFFNQILYPAYLQAKFTQKNIIIDLDDCIGYPSSFITGSFGLLLEKFPKQEVFSILKFTSQKDPALPDKIIKMLS